MGKGEEERDGAVGLGEEGRVKDGRIKEGAEEKDVVWVDEGEAVIEGDAVDDTVAEVLGVNFAGVGVGLFETIGEEVEVVEPVEKAH